MTDRRNNNGSKAEWRGRAPRGSARHRPARRSYGQYCGLAHALDVIGERWTLLILRDLLLGPRRYGGLLEGLRGAGGSGITTNLLAKRLKELEQSGLIERADADGGGHAYRLTAVGAALEPAIQELARWGGSHFMHGQRPDELLSLGWILLNLKRKVRPREGRVLIEVSDLDDDRYTLSLGKGGLEVHAGVPLACDAALRGDPLTLHRALFKLESTSRLRRAGLLQVSGDRNAVRQLIAALRAGAAGD